MNYDSVVIRVNYRDLLTIYKEFPPFKWESVANYFKRLAIELKGGRIQI